MKKIGFIDYYLDNWHANNYPEFISSQTDEMKVCYAWGAIDKEGGLTSEQWAQKYGVELCGSIDEVIEKSDCIIVLSPNNPEMHEKLSEAALKSGKLTYVDKTFAPDKETAERIFAYAEKHNTPFYSTSALRFSSELDAFRGKEINTLYSRGGGTYTMYSIHQIEPIVILMGTDAKRVMFTGDEMHPSMIIEFADGRYAHMYQTDWASFEIATVDNNNKYSCEEVKSDFTALFIKNVIDFSKQVLYP